MTDKEKVKAYNEVRKKIAIRFGSNVADEFFAEFEESEDEKIRKELTKHLKELSAWKEDEVIPVKNPSYYRQWASWLEKQGELVNSLSKGLDNAHERIDKLIQKNNELCVKLEKQGEQEKDILEDAILDGYILDGNEDGLIAETIRYKNEKRGGQKYAYKVKPKFNIGDWITNGIDVDKIIGIDLEDENYLFENGRKSDISLVDSNSHNWTIQDAKDSDILAVEDKNFITPFVAIYKERGLDFFNSRCFIGFDGNFYKSEQGHDIENIHPATKEQCIFLFQKMHEAGYEWDDEKKELKKIKVNEAMYDDDKLREAICE